MTFSPEHAVSWTEIPVADLDAGRRFYETVFQWKTHLVENPHNDFAFFTANENGVSGHLYPGKPAGDGTGPTIHLNVPGTLEEAADRVRGAGGTVLDMPPIEIPQGRFAYALDPDGNSIGLFEAAKG